MTVSSSPAGGYLGRCPQLPIVRKADLGSHHGPFVNQKIDQQRLSKNIEHVLNLASIFKSDSFNEP